MATRFRIFYFLVALIIIGGCGPTPKLNIKPPKEPDKLWEFFEAKYDSINSLALSGSFVIKGEKTYDTKLQLVYAFPDSFAFLAEATLGIDAARGAIIDGSGFWEIPREKFSEEITIDDYIMFDGNSIDIGLLLQAMFYFRDLPDYRYINKRSYKYNYSKADNKHHKTIELNGQSATPISIKITENSNMQQSVYTIDYYDWRKLGDSMLYPGRITVSSAVSGLTAEYNISKAKINPSLPASLFKKRH